MAFCVVRSALRGKIVTSLRQGFPRPLTCGLSTKEKVDEKDIKKSVFISQSSDVYTNLALEDWMYNNLDFTNHHVMLLWRNDPCVVIGRHQNPWCESDLTSLENNRVSLARRNSGGGAVYHDPGNLNITFFAPKQRYNRKNNLVLLAKTLEREWNLRPEISSKEDILIDDTYKISGTASRIGRLNTYHHCTLLVDVDKKLLKSSLVQNEEMSISGSTATKSAPSPTVNLKELHSGITVQKLVAEVGWQYLRTTALTQQDGGWNQVQKQNGFQLVNPSHDWFPGIDEIKNNLRTWEWRFGKTPKFTVSQDHNVGCGTVHIDINVEGGLVKDVCMTLPEDLSWGNLTGRVSMLTSARGQRFSPSIFTIVKQAIKQQQLHFTKEHQKQAARV
ncbi:lipoyltransferase 1, mitochondrial [Cimex lectularius]|uniref:BPL/LPL catalytic domain-containing protein n=1 Tax=Cimex lectularius TaxID=79782 RepID=A0A8I6RRX3_CIMLE|nr:lipoyltransferase 1, mitochondrial [Cimex lectularius]